MTGRPHAVVLRALGLGDLLAAVPALRGLRRALPEHLIVLACPAVLEPVVRLIGAVDAVHDAHGARGLHGDVLEWDGPRPEIAVNLHGNGPQSHRLLQALRPDRLVAFRRDDLGVPGPEWRTDEHEVRRWCRLVGEAFDAAVEPLDSRLATPLVPSRAPGAVVVHPGAAHPARRWPAERFAAVASALVDAGATVVVTGSADESELAEAVAGLAGLPQEAVLAGRTPLLELAALVAEAALVVSGDTGVAHLATAYAVPSVVLFGPTPPAWWGPLAGPHVSLWHGDGVGDPWADQPDPALLRITVGEVLAAAGTVVPAATSPTG